MSEEGINNTGSEFKTMTEADLTKSNELLNVAMHKTDVLIDSLLKNNENRRTQLNVEIQKLQSKLDENSNQEARIYSAIREFEKIQNQANVD